MNDWIVLTCRTALDESIAIDGVRPDRTADMSRREIGALPVWVGRHQAQLGDFFDIDGERSARIRIEGTTSRVDGLGAGMRGGELIIGGDAGAHTGAGMAGGTLQVMGHVGDSAGQAMSGGVLLVDGNAGAHLGAALPGASKGMTGGEIVVRGNAGSDAGARLRRGLIVVGGAVDRDAGRAMIAGTLVVLGSCGAQPGRNSKRGSLIACGSIAVPATYRYACTFHPPHVRLTLSYLNRRYGAGVADHVINSPFRRYCGDAGEPGKGEILERVNGV